jgi:hypothetical protein
LDAQGTIYEGIEAIARFYGEGAFKFADLLPKPNPHRIDEDQIVVNIDLHIAGMTTKVVDTFEMAGAQIRSLKIEGLTQELRSQLASAELN